MKHQTCPLSPLAWALLLTLILATGCGDSTQQANSKSAVEELPRYPETLAELEAHYPVIDATRNAALVYLEAFGKMTPPNQESRYLPWVGKGELPATGTRMSAATRREVSRWIQQNGETLVLLARASAIEDGSYPLDFSKGFLMEMRHLSQIKNASSLLALRAMLAVEDKDSVQATQSILQMTALSRSLKNEPATISQLVRFAVLSQATIATERGLNHQVFKEPDLRALLNALLKAEPDEALKVAAIGDRCMALHAFAAGPERMEAMLGVANPGGASITSLGAAYDFAGDQEFYRRTMDGYLVERSLPFPDRLTTRLQTAGDEAKAGKHLMSALLLPSVSRTVVREGRIFAELRTTQAALAIEHHRLAHQGSLPLNLSTLVPASISGVPIDPYTGKELLYAIRSPGYVVYSVGPDRVDNRGLERSDTTPSSFDVVLKVMR
jgi:hypothetical protein